MKCHFSREMTLFVFLYFALQYRLLRHRFNGLRFYHTQSAIFGSCRLAKVDPTRDEPLIGTLGKIKAAELLERKNR